MMVCRLYRFGVPPLLDADDAECWDDELSMLTYLAEVRNPVIHKETECEDAGLGTEP